jgi:hypothetical protein
VVFLITRFHEAAELVAATGVLQFAYGLGLDLTDALARDVKLLTDLFEGVVGRHLDTKPHAQHLGFTWGQAV